MTPAEVRVAVVCPEYRTDGAGDGGIAAVTDFVVGVCRDQGWSATIYTPRMSRKSPESRALLRPGSWFKRLQLTERPDGVVAVGAHLAEIEAVRYLPRRVLDRALESYDVVVIVSGTPAAALVSRRLKVPVVLQVATLVRVERAQALNGHSGVSRWSRRAMTALVSRMDLKALRIPATVLVENDWMDRVCREAGATKVTLAPPGVDTDLFRPGGSYQADGPIVMVARLGDARKDHSTLFRAYAHAKKKGLNRPLIVAGRGNLTEAEHELAQSLGLSESLTVSSNLSTGELVELLRSSSLFVTSSVEEGLGISIIEAMACGLPVVSTATAGARFVLGDSPAGELVPIGDSVRLGDALLAWTGARERRESASVLSRRQSVERFSLAATGKAFTAAIDEAARSSIRGDGDEI